MKTIVASSEIQNDPKLALVKAFRILNKKVGEAKAVQDESAFETCISEMKDLGEKAINEFGFKIWVNRNGKTGHTYEKDYKVTPDADNDFVQFINSLQSSMVFRLLPPGSLN